MRYYFIDFGLSRRYNPDDGPPREHPIRGGDKSVPEFKTWNGELLDPFPTDISYLGNVIKRTVLEVRGPIDYSTLVLTEAYRPALPRNGVFDSLGHGYDPA